MSFSSRCAGERLLQWLFFNLYTGNNDSHAKNLSFLLTPKNPRLAPFYDLMCTTVYPGFKNEFAFKVGSTFLPGDMQRSDVVMLAGVLGVGEKYLLFLAKSVAARVSAMGSGFAIQHPASPRIQSRRRKDA